MFSELLLKYQLAYYPFKPTVVAAVHVEGIGTKLRAFEIAYGEGKRRLRLCVLSYTFWKHTFVRPFVAPNG